jgi:sugar O-acyltransferase (sialic acid O-acetyltransferase NeuD family)
MDLIDNMKEKENCIIIGAGTYGQVYSEYLLEQYEIIGFIDDDKDLLDLEINNIKVLGDFEYLINNISKDTCIFVPIGNNIIRVGILYKLKELGYNLPNFIHSTVDIHKSVIIGKSVYILPHSNIMPFVEIMDFVMISMEVKIAHHTIISNGCFISQDSNIGASITLEENVFCGMGSIIMTDVKRIGNDSIIGAGTVVIKDVPNYAIVVGNPGRIIKYNLNRNNIETERGDLPLYSSTNSNSVILYGASGHSKVIIDILNLRNIQIKKIIDDHTDLISIDTIPIFKNIDFLLNENMIIAIGDNFIRKQINNNNNNINYINAIHPNTDISPTVTIGNGTVVMAGAVINSGSKIGEHCIINSKALVEHDCIISDFVHISPGVQLAGSVKVGEGTQIGIGAIVIQGLKIGKWATIGAGAVIIRDVPDYAVIVGNPGKIIKYNTINE